MGKKSASKIRKKSSIENIRSAVLDILGRATTPHDLWMIKQKLARCGISIGGTSFEIERLAGILMKMAEEHIITCWYKFPEIRPGNWDLVFEKTGD